MLIRLNPPIAQSKFTVHSIQIKGCVVSLQPEWSEGHIAFGVDPNSVPILISSEPLGVF